MVISVHLIAKIGLFGALPISYTGGEPMVRLGLAELGHTSAQLALLGWPGSRPTLRGVSLDCSPFQPTLVSESRLMPTIALVDDDRNILTSVSIPLEAEGYRIMTYTDGPSALDGFRPSPPALAILDLQIPLMHSIDTFHR